MRIPPRKVLLTEELDAGYVNDAGEPFYFTVPRSWMEWEMNQRREAERAYRLERDRPKRDEKGAVVMNGDGEPELAHSEPEIEKMRRSFTAKSLDMVREWNLSGVEGSPYEEKPLPLPRSLTKDDEKVKVLASLPTEVVSLILEMLWRPAERPNREAVAGFSEAS